jgi:pilus assembly protein Flp/PilA
MRAYILRFRESEAGVTAIEYGLIAALISVTLLTVLHFVYDQLYGIYSTITVALGG